MEVAEDEFEASGGRTCAASRWAVAAPAGWGEAPGRGRVARDSCGRRAHGRTGCDPGEQGADPELRGHARPGEGQNWGGPQRRQKKNVCWSRTGAGGKGRFLSEKAERVQRGDRQWHRASGHALRNKGRDPGRGPDSGPTATPARTGSGGACRGGQRSGVSGWR